MPNNKRMIVNRVIQKWLIDHTLKNTMKYILNVNINFKKKNKNFLRKTPF